MIRNIAPAVAINMAMGLIYIWSLFLLPLETALGTDCGTLSLVASLALVAFTLGMVVYSSLLARFGPTAFALLAFGLLGGGFLLFGLWSAYATLLLGHGGAFGFGAGLGYGLALSLATGTAPAKRALAIGLVMAAFALSGILLPPLLGGWVTSDHPAAIFRWLGLACLVLGILIALFLNRVAPPLGGTGEAQTTGLPVSMLSAEFLRLFLIFFLICFVGLMLVSQVSGIAAGQGLAQSAVLASTSVFTIGYLLGSLLGGPLVEWAGGWLVLVGVNLLSVVGLLMLGIPAAATVLMIACAIGFTFGSSASVMPVLIGSRFGADWIGPVYGRLMIAYGLAGLLAPWISGVLYATGGSYSSSLTLAGSMTRPSFWAAR